MPAEFLGNGVAQQIGRMIGNHRGHLTARNLHLIKVTSHLRNRLCLAQKPPDRVLAHQNQKLGLQEVQLSIEEGRASGHFIGLGVAVSGRTALENVADGNVLAALERTRLENFS